MEGEPSGVHLMVQLLTSQCALLLTLLTASDGFNFSDTQQSPFPLPPTSSESYHACDKMFARRSTECHKSVMVFGSEQDKTNQNQSTPGLRKGLTLHI